MVRCPRLPVLPAVSEAHESELQMSRPRRQQVAMIALPASQKSSKWMSNINAGHFGLKR